MEGLTKKQKEFLKILDDMISSDYKLNIRGLIKITDGVNSISGIRKRIKELKRKEAIFYVEGKPLEAYITKKGREILND